MIVDLNGNKFRVTFSHDVIKRPNDPEFPEVRVTRCFIWKGEGPKRGELPVNNVAPVGIGAAICNPAYDQFVKNKGRKYAMARALSHARFDKEARTKFWEAYKETRHGKV